MPGWRPLKFKTAEELEKKIALYFESCYEVWEDGTKKKIKPYTITWLANFLDTNRQTLVNYENKDDKFFDTIKRAKGKVEEDIETWALTNGLNPTASIFNLKNNFGWVDKQEVQSTNTNISLEVEDWDDFKQLLKDNDLI